MGSHRVVALPTKSWPETFTESVPAGSVLLDAGLSDPQNEPVVHLLVPSEGEPTKDLLLEAWFVDTDQEWTVPPLAKFCGSVPVPVQPQESAVLANFESDVVGWISVHVFARLTPQIRVGLTSPSAFLESLEMPSDQLQSKETER